MLTGCRHAAAAPRNVAPARWPSCGSALDGWREWAGRPISRCSQARGLAGCRSCRSHRERACDECGLVSPPHTPRGPAQTRASDTCRPSISPPGSPSTAAADAAMSPWEIVRSASPFSTPAPSASIQTLRQEASPLRWLRKPFVVSRGPRPVRVPEGSAALFFPCRPDSTSPRPRASREAGPYSSQPAGTASTRPIGRRPFPRSSPASGAARISA